MPWDNTWMGLIYLSGLICIACFVGGLAGGLYVAARAVGRLWRSRYEQGQEER